MMRRRICSNSAFVIIPLLRSMSKASTRLSELVVKSRIPIQSVLNNRALHPQPDRVNVITINVVPFPLPASRGSPHLNFVNLHALACLLPLPLPTQLHCNSVTAMEPPCCACSSRRETQQCEPASRVAQIYSAWARSTKVEASILPHSL